MTLKFFHARLIKLWQPKARLEVIDLDNEYFVIRFEDWDDLQHFFEDGPWMIAGHYIVIQRWKPGFSPYANDLRRVALWVRVPGLPIEYYDNKCSGSLSFAQTVLAALPSYTMQSMLLPKGICSKIEKYCREFIWGDKLSKRAWHTVLWDDFTLPKKMGGWGFKDLFSFNKAMIMKLKRYCVNLVDLHAWYSEEHR
ncbi:hypothetical protein SESBI_02265 [Sesbania bispinosa]|nr:hypothetical protein SESBI_02265 [Sesbania bispinosa]